MNAPKTVTKEQIADAAIVFKTASDIHGTIIVAYDSGEISRERYNDEIDPAEEAMRETWDNLRALIERFEDEQVKS